MLKVPAGTLENKNGATVTLLVKEAFTLQQIIKAGLFTASNSQPLSSGGMIYIDAKESSQIIFKQRIQVAIPSDFLQPGMQLYKGAQQANGQINWDSPENLPENKQLNNLEYGKQIFVNNCASCHAVGKCLTAPDLAHFMKRFPPDESNSIYYFHYTELYRMFSEMGAQDTARHAHYDLPDNYKCNLQKLSGMAAGVPFPSLSFSDRLAIMKYVQNESDRRNLRLPEHAYLKDCVDSCETYIRLTGKLNKLKNLSISERQRLSSENGPMFSDNNEPGAAPPTTTVADFDEKVSPQYFGATYYQFSIENFGWYNIDILLKGIEGVSESKLLVRIVGEYRKRISISLIIPSRKVFVAGGPAGQNTDSYAFYSTNGSIPLPQKEKAFVLAVTEENEKIAFAVHEFVIKPNQEFSIELKEASKEAVENAVQKLNIENFTVSVSKTENADSIILLDKEIKDIELQLKKAEKLKPGNCDCDCGMPVAERAY
ncbi:c-type cytochrome [Foetidibacter luteolus]|uniref:c-type cytochrome n=1 Tax=Foetidibacter luteolus TaxID=2608880 RepID=UPI001A97FB32|nr:cytochrome c [Foetidibacter luteolus]